MSECARKIRCNSSNRPKEPIMRLRLLHAAPLAIAAGLVLQASILAQAPDQAQALSGFDASIDAPFAAAGPFAAAAVEAGSTARVPASNLSPREQKFVQDAHA